MVTTTNAIKAVFETYAVFASGSCSRLDQVKSKGLCRHPGPFGLDFWNAQDNWDFPWLCECGRDELASTYCGCEKLF